MRKYDAGPSAFAKVFDVSRETLAMLTTYETLLRKWTPKINLVSPTSLNDLWSRHFIDSAQIWRLASRRPGHWVDMGSGAGFPGLVVAIMARNDGSATQLTLIESDTRKVAFLLTVCAELDLACGVLPARIEQLSSLGADVVSARALAPLSALLPYAEKHRRPSGICLFPKGATVHKEIEHARGHWVFDHRLHPSLTDRNAAVIEIGAMTRV